MKKEKKIYTSPDNVVRVVSNMLNHVDSLQEMSYETRIPLTWLSKMRNGHIENCTIRNLQKCHDYLVDNYDMDGTL